MKRSIFIVLGASIFLLAFGGVAVFLRNRVSVTPIASPLSSGEVASSTVSPGVNSIGEYNGTVLAGSTSKLIDFNRDDYNQAIASDKLVVLYFYANWCPICREEVPKMYQAFNQLTSDEVVGFRVNFNDNETDDDERTLASQFGVAYQHTKVFLKNKERVLKSPETWETERYLTEIENRLIH
jgi:thiol-disulfide isomerase/thioredoxin